MYVWWIFACRLSYGCCFDNLFRVSSLAMISALEYWGHRIRDYDEWAKTTFECREEHKEALIAGSMRVQEGMVIALNELAGMLTEAVTHENHESGVKT